MSAPAPLLGPTGTARHGIANDAGRRRRTVPTHSPKPLPLAAGATLLALFAGVFLGSLSARAAEASTPAFAVPSATEILAPLRPTHPRLFAAREDFERLRNTTGTDPVLRLWRQRVLTEATNQLSARPVAYEIPDGLRLLGVSRRIVDRAYTLGLAWQLTGDARFVAALGTNLAAAAAFPDWNPRHFLDTAEMAHGFGVALDWCWDAWTPAQREQFRAALIEKGLKPGLKIYRESAEKGGGWPRARHNWNQVCNGGLTLGALAIADEAGEVAGEIVASAVRSLPLAMAEYAPDGGWAEGPGYWNYATIYNVAMIAGLQSALGTDFGLAAIPGFAETGSYALHVASVTGRTFNYADGRDGVLRAPHLFWLARRFQQPRWAAVQKASASPHPLDLVWYDPALANATNLPAEPLDKYFRQVEAVTLRSAWPGADAAATGRFSGRNALFVGFKAGDNKVNHSHLDVGSFVFDVFGLRWISDYGGDDYNLPGYFGKQRWDYYLNRAEGHNTLVLHPGSGPDQDPQAATRILRFESRPDTGFAIADLTPAYAAHAQRVHRGIALRDGRTRVQVRDEIEAGEPVDVLWFLHTTARVELGGREAVLNLGPKKVWVGVVSDLPVQFQLRDPTPLPGSPNPSGQMKVSGKKLTLEIPKVTRASFSVYLVPIVEGDHAPTLPALADEKPLAEWK